MPQPTRSDVHVNQPLTNISIAYIQKPSNFVADKVFANIPVKKASDVYYTYDKESWFRDEMEKRAPGTESAGGGYTVNADAKYSVDRWSLHKDVDDDTRDNSDDPLDADRDATMWLTQKAMLRKEKEFVSNYFKTTVWGTDYDVTSSSTIWTNAASDPVGDVDDQKEAILEKTGFEPNTIVVSPKVFKVLKNHPYILDLYKHTQKGIITEDLLAEVFGVENFLVARATNNIALENATANMSFVFSDAMLLCYSNPNPSIMTPSAGYTFSWTERYGNSAMGHRMKKFRREAHDSDRIEIDMWFDMKLVGADLGCFLHTCI